MEKLATLEDTEVFGFIAVLQKRFEQHMHRHEGIDWSVVQGKLEASPKHLQSIYAMEQSEGEPDVVSIYGFEEIVYVDCSAETPKGRRSLCYDEDALESRKKDKPRGSAVQMAKDMGIKLLNEKEYAALQSFGSFDAKTSSWLETESSIRDLGGAIFGDYRFGRVFTYHNGAESYYSARGFRGLLKL